MSPRSAGPPLHSVGPPANGSGGLQVPGPEQQSLQMSVINNCASMLVFKNISVVGSFLVSYENRTAPLVFWPLKPAVSSDRSIPA